MDDDRLYSPWKSPPKVAFCKSLTVSGGSLESQSSPRSPSSTSPQKASSTAAFPAARTPLKNADGTVAQQQPPPVSPHVAAIEKSQRQLEEERERLRAERLRQKALLADLELAEAERTKIIKKFAADVRADVEQFHAKLDAVPPPTATVGGPQAVKFDTPFTRTVPVPPPRPQSPPRKPVMRDGKFAVVEDAIADRGWLERERLDNVHQREAFVDYEAQRKQLELERREAIKALHEEQERQMTEFRDRLERHRPPSPDIVTNWTQNPFRDPQRNSPQNTPRRLGYDSPVKSPRNPAAAGPPDLVLNSARRPVQPADPRQMREEERSNSAKSPRQQLGTLVAPL